MNITGTINAGMSKMARSMRNSVDNCKTDGKIAAFEGEKKKTTIICEQCGKKCNRIFRV